MRKKRLICLLLALFAAVLTTVCPSAPLHAETAEADLGLTSRSALLMEASTGTVLYEQNADEELSPASITKIMTLLLIFDALEEGKIALTDQVTTSAYAKSMGGSQVFLEEGEQQTVETMIKCIVIASGNDAAVAMAEYLAGSETEFVRQMNARAEGLKMSGTHFEDCCGLSESDTHRTTARDVAIMSRELITRYPQISDYATIWMENITHITANGTSEFTLSNTNKLLKMTQSFRVTGLKTGSTSLAKYCFSGTAEQDGIHLIAVVMAAPDYKTRFSEAQSMLNYGFSLCSLYEDTDSDREELPELPVERGKTDTVPLAYADSFSYLSTTGEDFSQIERRVTLASSLTAPAEEGTVVGSLEYILDGRTLGSVDIVTTAAVEQAGYTDILRRFWETFLDTGFAV
ncbi:MAG: D-alanyl-D-alanine carboxypeptidase [Lachnospiraceae bacterium]|nr:D-alanyl-D-alanine carboxypeptidase [Lachnospiraceae bacterium]